MNKGWKTTKIGLLGKVITGKTPSTRDPDNFGGDYPFITIPDLDGEVFIEKVERTLSQKGASKVKSALLPANTVMMSCIATVGKCGITTKPSFTNQQINSVICNKDTDPRFLYYTFTQLGHELEASGGGGSVYTNVSKSRFSDIPIQVPSLPEQRAIADVLSALDDKIELNRRINQTLEELAQALYRYWFIDNLEVETWEDGTLSDICSISIGGDWGSELSSGDDCEVICLRGVDLEYLRVEGYSDKAPVRWIKKSSLEKRRMSDCDVLIAGSGVGPVGRPLWVAPSLLHLYEHEIIYSNFCKRFTAKSPAYAVFIDRVLHNLHQSKGILDYVNGTSLPNLDANGLINNYLIKIPPADIVEQYYESVNSFYAFLYNKENQTLADLRDTLLPKLMSGQIKVQ